tara:strand:+ start:2704 stop:3561 length:858 start_codon:yes stop_codon:yes gene_type:complete
VLINNILVLGAKGQLGSEIEAISCDFHQYNFLFTDSFELDITKHQLVNDYIELNKINVIINCAAYTNVEKAESEPELADKINHIAVGNLAKTAKKKNIKLIHISTDYVFDGESQKPYNELDATNPQTTYGKTKLNGEKAIKKINPLNSVIIRTSWVYSKYGKNFVKTMLELAKKNKEISIVSDQMGCPTNAADLAKLILEIIPKIKNSTVQIYHYSNEGECSWYDFAKEIFNFTNHCINLKPIDSRSYTPSVKRPTYSVLSKNKIIKSFDVEVLHWKESFLKFDL